MARTIVPAPGSPDDLTFTNPNDSVEWSDGRIRKRAATKKSFANMITVIRLHQTSYVGLLDFIKDTYRAWRKTDNASFALSL